MAAHRLLLLRLTDSRSANHMCVPPTSTSAPLSSAFTFPRLGCVLLFPLALPVSLPSLRVSTTKRTQRLPNHRCPLFSRFEERKPCPPPLRRLPLVCPASALYTLCAKPFPMHPSGLVATACNGATWPSPQRLHVSTPAMFFAFSLCMFTRAHQRSSLPSLHPPTTSPSSRPFSRGRAQARTNAARAHAQTRATAPWRNIAPVQSFCVRARARLCERSRAQACPYLLSPPLFGSFTASPCHCRVLRAEASRNHHCSIQRMDSQGAEPWTSRMLSGCDTTTPQALLHNTHTQT